MHHMISMSTPAVMVTAHNVVATRSSVRLLMLISRLQCCQLLASNRSLHLIQRSRVSWSTSRWLVAVMHVLRPTVHAAAL